MLKRLLGWLVPFGIIVVYFLVGLWAGITQSPPG
jgi:hypothetical protein